MTDYYSPARRPCDEADRQRAVDASGFAHAADDPALAEIVAEAAALFDAPMAAISIVDRDRQWFPAEIGVGVGETSRAAAFCAHTILDPDKPMCIPDTAADGRFAGNPLVLSGPRVRYYMGTPLIGEDGQRYLDLIAKLGLRK